MVGLRQSVRTNRRGARSQLPGRALVEVIEPRVLLSAADFDPSFGSGGLARVDLSGNHTRDGGKDLVVQPADGKLVLGGYTTVGSYADLDNAFVVARFNPDGSPDASFGTAGVARAAFDAPALRGVELDAVALQPDGKIVAGGIEVEFEFGYEWNFALARFNADGTPDATFGNNGTVVLNFGSAGSYDRVTDLAVRPDGRIVAVGVTQQDGLSDFALAQFNSNGTLDTTFGDGGKTRHVVGYSAWPTASSLLPDGRLVVAGYTRTGIVSFFPVSVSLTRYTADGKPDSTFGVGGVDGQSGLVGATVDNIGEGGADDLAVDPQDGSLYVAAHVWAPGTANSNDPPSATEYLVKYTPDGRRVPSFGLNGLAFLGQVAGEQMTGIALDGSGVVSAMTSGSVQWFGQNANLHWTLERHTTFGGLDLSFGGGDGVTTRTEQGSGAKLFSLAALPSGALVTGGTDATDAANSDAQVTRIRGGVDAGTAGTISGTLFKDADQDFRRDLSEVGVEGQSVFIDTDNDGAYDPGEPLTTAGADGRYAFTGLAPGPYTIRTRLSGTWNQTSPPDAGAHRWTLPAGRGLGGADFGLVQRPKITLSSFEDLNANGVFDPGEPPLGGQVVWMDKDNDGLLDPDEPQQVFDAQGRATFQVTPGTYRFRQGVPANDFQTTPPSGTALVVTVGGEDISVVGFGNVSRNSVGRIDGAVWLDANGNGTKEAGEVGSTGSVVYLDANDNGVLDAGERSVASVSGGSYSFPLTPPGTYTVRMVTSRGQELTTPAAGSYTVQVVGNNAVRARDFGYRWRTNRVIGRHVFYNNSAYDGGSAGPDAGDDRAVAPDKQALLPGQTASAANVTSYGRGINGVMIDVDYVPPGAVVDDFAFTVRRGTTGDPANWEVVPMWDTNLVHINVRRGAGEGGSDRITLTFADGAVKNTWLRVTAKDHGALALPSADVFYFGNLVGDTGDSDSAFRVNALDLGRVKQELNRTSNITGRFDFNRDGRVNALDLGIVKANLNRTLSQVAAPAPAPPASLLFSDAAADLSTLETTARKLWDEPQEGIL